MRVIDSQIRIHRQIQFIDLVLIIMKTGPYEYARIRAAQPIRVARILRSRVNALQKQPDLRIHPLRLASRYVEKSGIEFIHAVNETAPLTIGFVLGVSIFIKPRAIVPMILRDFPHDISCVA